MARYSLSVLAACVLVICLLTSTANAAVSIARTEEKPSHLANLSGCYSSEVQQVIPAGSHYDPIDGKSCKRLICDEDNGGITEFTCGIVGANPPCRVTPGDLTKPYPKCCSRIVCG